MTAVEELNQITDPNGEKQFAISLNDLIIGRRLQSPLYSKDGVLLLAAGSVLTKEIKDALRHRVDRNVYISQEDVSRVTLKELDASKVKSITAFDTDLTQKMDSIVNSGLLAIKNNGPAVKSSLSFLGCKGYDKKQRERLIVQHQENSQSLDHMMSEALHGKAMDGDVVASMASQYLQEMTADTDSVLTSAMGEIQATSSSICSIEVALLAMAIGIEMNLDAENSRNLAIAGMVHNWGMIRVPEEIRNSKTRLNEVQMLEIKKQPIYSLEMLQKINSLPRVISVIAYQVHERFNGTGYPRGRQGDSIHPLARILQVADAFVSMTSKRPYRPPMMRYAAMECLIRQAKDRYVDPDIVRMLLRIQSLFPIGSFVTLTNGAVAQVVRRNQDFYTQPIVACIQDENGDRLDPEDEKNIINLNEVEDLEVLQALPTPGSKEIAFHEDFYNSPLQTIYES